MTKPMTIYDNETFSWCWYNQKLEGINFCEDPNTYFQNAAVLYNKIVYEFDPPGRKSKHGPKDFLQKAIDLLEMRNHYIDVAIPNTEEKHWFIKEDSYLLIKLSEENIDTFLLTFDKEQHEKYISFFNENTEDNDEKAASPIYVVSAGGGGLRLEYAGDALSLCPGQKGLVKENYTEEVIEKYEYIKSQFNSKVPQGRIAILHGEPGSGKTYFIRSLVSELNRNVKTVFITPDNFPSISKPEFTSLLLSEKDQDTSYVLILEDADLLIEERQNSPYSISTLLNYSDGILGGIIDIRIIATTNVQLEGIDKALLRPGRLLDCCSVEARDREDAIKIYKRLLKVDEVDESLFVKDKYTLAEVYEISSREVKNTRKIDLPGKKAKVGF